MSLYTLTGYGQADVWATGNSTHICERPSCIIRPDLLKLRAPHDFVFKVGEELDVVLDCIAHTVTVRSCTVQYTFTILPEHYDLQWVLNVGAIDGGFKVKLL